MSVCMHTDMYVRMYVCIHAQHRDAVDPNRVHKAYISVCVCLCICLYLQVYIYLCVCMYVCIPTHTFLSICAQSMQTCIHTCIHTYIHIHIHTYSFLQYVGANNRNRFVTVLVYREYPPPSLSLDVCFMYVCMCMWTVLVYREYLSLSLSLSACMFYVCMQVYVDSFGVS